PGFRILLCRSNNRFIPRDSEVGKISGSIKTSHLCRRSELWNGGRIVVWSSDILPVSDGIEIEDGLLSELAIVVRPILVLFD
ncbi:hypothetical protein K438DRAFT_1522806, partial [Mycena galopus ATCC 62051]